MATWPGRVGLISLLATSLAGCGLYVPEKDPFSTDMKTSSGGSIQGNYEISIVNHIECELINGLLESKKFELPWLFNKWGVTTTLSITAEDQTGFSPGISFIKPFSNMQSALFSVGGTASVNSLRTETIQFTLRNKDLATIPCPDKSNGVLIDGNLKIGEFVYDKAVIAASRNVSSSVSDFNRPTYNTWTEEITFVSAYGGSTTPTWKLTTISSGTSSNLLVAQRTNTNDVVITFGPLLDPGDKSQALSLSKDAMNQHIARVQASAIAVSGAAQMH